MVEPLLQVRDLVKRFPVRRGVMAQTVGYVHAVEGVSFDLMPGESLGLVGESGCGKTTTGRCLLRLDEPTSGSIQFAGQDLCALSQRALRLLRPSMQMIFQDPFGCLNPRMTVERIIAEPLLVHGQVPTREAARQQVVDLLQRVGLEAEDVHRYPHQFSGGQRQRIGIARALALQPQFIVCDEPVSALDVSVQAQVVNLLQDLQQEFGIAYVFIAHDLSVVAHLCHRVAVMYMGQIVELAPVELLYQGPLHPYTQSLLSAIPPDMPGESRQRIPLNTEVPSPLEAPSAARYRARFPEHAAAFADDMTLQEVAPGHWVRCSDPAPLLASMTTY